MRYWLGSSLALNLCLLTTIVAARVDATREPAMETGWQIQSSQFGSSPTAGDPVAGIGDLALRLEPTGLGTRDIKRLILGWLSGHYAQSEVSTGPYFWQSEYRPGLTTLRRQIEVDEKIRDSLIAFFGRDAATDPAFNGVFRPLGPEYDFLSPEAQRELQKRQLELLESRDSRLASSEMVARCQSIAMSANRARPPMLPEELEPSVEREYQLRFSPVAAQLRESVATNDEQYFRSLFDRIAELEENPSPRAQARSREELRAEMGDQAFDRFWSSRDPMFAHVQNYLIGRGFAEQQIFDAYSIVNRSQESLLVAIANNRSQESILRDVQQIRSDESAGLVRLLGDEIAAGLAAAMAQAAISLSAAAKASC